jgi:galactokinase
MMDTHSQMIRKLKSPEAMERLARLYGRREGELVGQMARYTSLVKWHEESFHGGARLTIVSAPGRAEIIGNHTDHNSGKVLAAAVTLDTIAAVTPCEDTHVHVRSEGYPDITLDLSSLAPVPEEQGTSAALIRGVSARMKECGFAIGGFSATVSSQVPSGSGLSSSAAFEVLICAVQDALYNGFTMDSTLRAQIAQYAENVYFGKPCGLMDQMASSTGGMVAIDFKHEPVVDPLKFSFAEAGYDMVVVNTGGTHDDLTGEYASIREEMQRVAGFLGEKALRRVRPEQVLQNTAEIRKAAGDRAVLRALHFFNENARVTKQVHALRGNDLPVFFANIIKSGESSWMLLQNVYARPDAQPLALALALAENILQGKGAWRVHGGGFAGTTLNFVPSDMTECFTQQMKAIFGEHSCSVLDVRAEGAALVFKNP